MEWLSHGACDTEVCLMMPDCSPEPPHVSAHPAAKCMIVHLSHSILASLYCCSRPLMKILAAYLSCWSFLPTLGNWELMGACGPQSTMCRPHPATVTVILISDTLSFLSCVPPFSAPLIPLLPHRIPYLTPYTARPTTPPTPPPWSS